MCKEVVVAEFKALYHHLSEGTEIWTWDFWNWCDINLITAHSAECRIIYVQEK